MRFACASASKHCFHRDHGSNAHLPKLIDGLSELLNQEVDIEILTAVVKSITTALYSRLDVVGRFFNRNESLFDSLNKHCLSRFERRELDFGNFKEIRDDAKVIIVCML